ncbi:MAG: TolC family protein, partial [Burkholderiales bacterium]|nr:TolC family protein [Burkholderiales bacterium]
MASTLMLALVLALMHAPAARATGLLQAWQAAAAHDPSMDVAAAARATAAPRREQARALWRPTVDLTGSLGLASGSSQTRGAAFSAAGLGRSEGVGFDTSINGGRAGRWGVQAMQPLYDPARRARQAELELSADLAELQWQAARQSLMLRTAERYFDLALAQQTLLVLQRQAQAVQRADDEAKDRYSLGSAPITDVHEARARLAAVQAQLLAAQTALAVQRERLADSTALPPDTLSARLPAEGTSGGPADTSPAPVGAPRTLADWGAA